MAALQVFHITRRASELRTCVYVLGDYLTTSPWKTKVREQPLQLIQTILSRLVKRYTMKLFYSPFSSTHGQDCVIQRFYGVHPLLGTSSSAWSGNRYYVWVGFSKRRYAEELAWT
jgi:hypothetical protein